MRITDHGRAVIAAERVRRAGWIAAAMESHLSQEERLHLAKSARLLERLAAAGPASPS